MILQPQIKFRDLEHEHKVHEITQDLLLTNLEQTFCKLIKIERNEQSSEIRLSFKIRLICIFSVVNHIRGILEIVGLINLFRLI